MKDPNVWGPPLWDLLFTFAFHLPASKAALTIDLFAQLEKVLPCQACRRSYAIHRKQVKPLTTLRASNASAAIWLWTIHDMVNQSLDKTAISYDKLERKHRLMTSLAHPLSALDVLCIMSSTVKPRNVAEFASTVAKCAEHCPGMAHLAAALPTRLSENNVRDELREAHSRLRSVYGMPAIDTDEFDRRFPCLLRAEPPV